MLTPDKRCRALLAAVTVLMVACGDDDADDSSTVDASTLDGRTFVATEVEGETLVDGTELTLSFDGDAVAALAGCNSMRSGFEIEDGSLVVDQLAQTQMACEDAKQAQDAWVAELLSGRPTIDLDDDTLTLSSDPVTVTFRDDGA